jgi:methyl-accepting chemotaxis protein
MPFAAAAAPAWTGHAWRFLAWCGVLAGAAWGGLPGLAAAAVCGGALAWWAGPGASKAQAPAPLKTRPAMGDEADDLAGDAAGMVCRVAPVWSRQLQVTRGAADEGMNHLLSAFSSMSDVLGTLTDALENFQPAAAAGAVGEAIAGQHEALDKLLAPLQRAFAQRDALLVQLGECTRSVARLQQLSKEAREIGRHTRLVSFNANIEAHRGSRGHGQDGGSQQVAAELRVVSERVVAICNRMDLELASLSGSATAAHREGLLHDTAADELKLEVEQRAREALQALLSGLGASTQGAGQLREASRDLRFRLDEAFTHFQFGDRVAQMLDILAKDMQALTEHLRRTPHPAAGEAQAWLKRLEASYTMEEQRSHHHGNQHVDRGSEVEFF